MSNRPQAAGADARRRRRLGRLAAALAAVLLSWTAGSGDARAERIILKSGEVIEGSIVEATRNTVIVRRSIGGMRQMRIADIAEVRFDLSQGQEMAGEFLSWTDGIYEVRAGDEVIRLSEGGIVSREPRQQTAERSPRGPISPRLGQQQITAAAPRSVAATRTAAPAPDDESQSNAAAAAESEAAADARRSAAGGTENQAAAVAQGEAAADAEAQAAATAAEGEAADAESQAAAMVQGEAAGDAESPLSDARREAAADAESKAAPDAPTRAAADADGQAGAEVSSRTVAGDESAAVGDQASLAVGDQANLAVKASVDPPEPGARSMVFKIELSQPAARTVVLIYGTVDGTAKAGEDYEPQQGTVTLTPGAKSAEVHVPLLGGQPEDGDKRFELVLMADPKVADIVDRRVTATIKAAD